MTDTKTQTRIGAMTTKTTKKGVTKECPSCGRKRPHVNAIGDSDGRIDMSWKSCPCGWNNLTPEAARQVEHLRSKWYDR